MKNSEEEAAPCDRPPAELAVPLLSQSQWLCHHTGWMCQKGPCGSWKGDLDL